MVIDVSTEGGVCVITLQRPERRNAVNDEVQREMTAALDEIEADPTVRAIILTGAGDRAFSAGADLTMAASGRLAEIAHPVYGFAGFTQRPIAVPTIAAVNGAALAGGFELVLACDLVVAAENAVFGIPEVKRGLMAVAGGLVRLPNRIPPAIALELGLTGDPVSARRALELGLVNQVVPEGEALRAADALARRIAANAPLAVRASKAVMLLAARDGEEAGWRNQMDLAALAMNSPDLQEGARAFLEKRPPRWSDPG